MKFSETKIKGVWLIDLEPSEDVRGFFARTYDHDEFDKHGLNTFWPQCNTSLTYKFRTIRGMHWSPYEIKLVRCTRGAIFDVVVDLRLGSETFGKWQGWQITCENRKAVYIPNGIAHGFQCLIQHSEVAYMMGCRYCPMTQMGLNWNDPDVKIDWPFQNPILSERDSDLPFLKDLK